ncbi:MAG TPA: ATP-binding cassette domain-containing protein, partial [Thermoanaerobaculia bacterium]|nr:ATP-binding cassette domain-containing protein [Thermoanaerobaculia bacterium]
MTDAIAVHALSKSYGSTIALRDLSFTVPAGAIYGLIGANGAGKTTTLSILAGLLAPNGGQASILGTPVRTGAQDLAHDIGFYSAQYPFFDYLTGREILTLAGQMHGLSRQSVEAHIADLLDLFDLDAAADHYVYEYSQGMRQKLGLASALIHAPRVLMLDEPFDGLDATAQYRLVATLRKIAGKGKAVLLTSHDLALVERVCDRVGILHDGRVERE